LLVVLDRVGRAGLGFVGFESGGAAGAALAQEVPALVECDLELSEAPGRAVVERRVSVLVAKLVLLVDEFVDAVEDLLVVHPDM